MKKLIPGFTGLIPKGADYFETLKKYAGYGYKLTEGAAACFREGDPKENAKRIRDMGLELWTLGTTVQNGAYPDVKDLADRCHLVGVDHVTMYHSSSTSWRFADRDEHPGYDEAMGEIERMNRLANDLKKEGITFVFHNHDQEFITTFNGVQLFWLIAANCENLKFELDTCWAHYAGENVPRLVKILGDRLAVLHVKDYTRGENFEDKPRWKVTVPRYTTPGSGIVDLQAVFMEAVKIDGLKYAIIEQDMPNKVMHDQIMQAAITNLRETGYVE